MAVESDRKSAAASPRPKKVEEGVPPPDEVVAEKEAVEPAAREPALPHPPLSSKFKSSFSQIAVEPGPPTLPTLLFNERTAELVVKVSFSYPGMDP